MDVVGIDEDQIRREILSDFLKISEVDIFSKLKCIVDESIITSDPVQTFFLLNEGELFNRLFKPVILDAVIKSERVSAGSGELCLNLILRLIPQCLRDIRGEESHKNICDELSMCEDRQIKKITSLGRKLDRETLYKILDQEITGEKSKEISRSILETSNLTTSVFVEKSNSIKTKIRTSSGYYFNIGASDIFLMGKRKWKKDSVKCIIIDGMIETVGEIHHLLEESSSSDMSYVIFAREFKPEVLNTIYVNLQRGTIDVMPISVGLDENTINILNDIASVCEADVVSSYKGDLISSAVKEELPVMESISIFKDNLIIERNDRPKTVINQVSYLKSKRDMQRTGEMRNLYDKRIKSLLSDRVTVSIGTDIRSKERSCIEEIDKFFRMIKSLIGYGYSKTELEKKSELSIYDDIVSDAIAKRGNLLPTACICVALRCAMSAIVSVCSLGYAIIEDI